MCFNHNFHQKDMFFQKKFFEHREGYLGKNCRWICRELWLKFTNFKIQNMGWEYKKVVCLEGYVCWHDIGNKNCSEKRAMHVE